MRNRENKEELKKTDEPDELYNRPGSNEHNDYRITDPLQQKSGSGHKDERESYMDYNGNSEENDPSKAE